MQVQDIHVAEEVLDKIETKHRIEFYEGCSKRAFRHARMCAGADINSWRCSGSLTLEGICS